MGKKPELRFKAVRSESIVSEVYRQIHEKLLSGAFSSGDNLKEKLLAEAMGVSRAPVREALRLLEQSGLVIKAHNRSYVVAPFNFDDIIELAALRFADETLAIRLAVQSQTSTAPMATALAAMRAAQTKGNVAEMSRADAAFHVALIEMTGLPRLIARYNNLVDQISFFLLTSDVRIGVTGVDQFKHHKLLLDTLIEAQRSGDPTPALDLWEYHILFSMQATQVFPPKDPPDLGDAGPLYT